MKTYILDTPQGYATHTRAASSMEAALARLDLQPGITTAAELAADDAEILPALVDGQPVTTPEPK